MAVKERSFWSTIPGLITGLAGLLTGIVGLLTVAVQLGWIGSDDGDNGSDSTETTAAPGGQDGGSGTTLPLLGGGARSATTAPAAGGLTVDPTSVSFSALGSREEIVTVRNTGGSSIGLRAPSITGLNRDQFTATNVDCGSSLGAGRSCTVKVTFAASRNGESTANLVIQPTSGAAKEVPLTGRALL